MRVARRGAAALVALLVALPLAACGTDSPAVCGSVDELSASIDHLGMVQLGENGRAELESQLAAVRADLAQVRTDADQQYGAQVDAVTAAVADVRDQLEATKAEPSASTLRPLVAAITGLGTAVRALHDAVAGTC